MDADQEDRKFHWSGIHRGKVIDDRDPDKAGRVKMWIPDVMPDIPETQGIWARPGNNPMGGRNTEEPDDQFYQGTCYIPPMGSWMYLFFENGDPSEPRYMAAADVGQGKVLAECQVGDEWQKKWVIFKSRQGRCIVVSDDPYDERVEITGKKRQIKEPPDGDFCSTQSIKGNQTTILLDEREGQEKILVKDYKGNYMNIDTENDSIQFYAHGDLSMRCGGTIFLTADKGVSFGSAEQPENPLTIKTSETTKGKYEITAAEGIIFHSGKNINMVAAEYINIHSTNSDINIDTPDGNLLLNCAASIPFVVVPTEKTLPLEPSLPDGSRDRG
jgi:hypothetical protein